MRTGGIDCTEKKRCRSHCERHCYNQETNNVWDDHYMFCGVWTREDFKKKVERSYEYNK